MAESHINHTCPSWKWRIHWGLEQTIGGHQGGWHSPCMSLWQERSLDWQLFSPQCAPPALLPRGPGFPGVSILGGLSRSLEYCASARISSPEGPCVSISASSKCWEEQPRKNGVAGMGSLVRAPHLALYYKNKKLSHILFSISETLNSSRVFLTLLLLLTASFYLFTNSEIHGKIYRIDSFCQIGLS